jgi:hypothetical protein
VNVVLNRPEKGGSPGYGYTTPTYFIIVLFLFLFAKLNSLKVTSETKRDPPFMIILDS